MSFFGLGGGGVQISIALTADPNRPGIVPVDRFPSWKLRKNPFWRLKYPQARKQQIANNNNNNNVAGHTLVAPQQSQDTMYYSTPGTAVSSNNIALDERSHQLYVYDAPEDVSGVVTLSLPPGKKQDHLGIKIEFIGCIDMGAGAHEGRPHYNFISLSKELSPPGVLYNPKTEIPFLFKNMDKELESYSGRNVSVRYFVRVIIERKFLPPISKEQDVWVQICTTPPTESQAIKMEVGIEDCLHIEFEYDRRHYHLQDVIHGNIHFLLVRIKIKHMELAVIRRETSGEGVAAAALTPSSTGAIPQQVAQVQAAQKAAENVATETQTLVKYEIMDGAPVKGEVIPVRLSLRGMPADLTPTYTAVNNRFSVRYFLNLVLVDEEDRRYFKQQEIILWRKELG
eukprot:CAMPEP_0195284120 /NCGR_PEP_ID=MMETSP0707-20130614/2436_1 /TAXON_ID=33640 /ORGANISM="Asterionellopsis glacialis, Strain CCMP134" /LENGTH=397 /DNA_ID=CAMNT_0040343421 /DNA_START=103 /DNA_END=1296 /DNA_ORIENTATION=+